MASMSFEPGHWSQGGFDFARRRLCTVGINPQDIESIMNVLGPLIVVTDYYVPSTRELFGQYDKLGEAYLEGRINVRWVMCQETHDALAEKYVDRRYPRVPTIRFFAEDPDPGILEDYVGMVMERQRTWTDTSMLFGIPIRIDPAARRPMFEMGP